MKVYKKEIKGAKVEAYKACGEWVVKCSGRTEYFKANEWKLRVAMEFMAELFGDMEPAI